MSLSVQYESIEEADMRLTGTVVLYDGEPVYVAGITRVDAGDPKPDVFRVLAEPLPYIGRGGEQFRKFISSKKFDLSTIRMGFCNSKKGLVYCSRAPKKQYKQGVASGTLKIEQPWNDDAALFGGRGVRAPIDFAGLISDPAFVDCIKGKYPSFNECKVELVKDEVEAMAFSRECALVKDKDLDALLYLYYKQEKVGFIFNDEVTLSKKVQFLKEALRELGLRV